jgi:hypothetical protein
VRTRSKRKSVALWLNDPQWAIVALTTSAFVVRLLVLLQTAELPADGPARAIYAWYWSQHPHIPVYGQWPPGFLYLSGAFFFLVSDPLFSTRVLNVILGTLTIPIFYALLRRVYDHRVALISSGVLAFMPMHVSISASSLSEVAYLVEALAGILWLVIGVEPFFSLVFLCLAVMTCTFRCLHVLHAARCSSR